jgi:hypothetical protein
MSDCLKSLKTEDHLLRVYMYKTFYQKFLHGKLGINQEKASNIQYNRIEIEFRLIFKKAIS